jgi:hypothetical protein
MKPFILFFSLLFSAIASAEIFEIIDKDGHKSYTDKPPLNHPDAKPKSIAPHTGNSWKTDAVHQSNDQFFDELKQEQQAEADAQEQLKAEKIAEQQKLQDDVSAAEEALKNAKAVTAGDYYPGKEHGMHYNEEYRNRVKNAEDELERAKAAAQNH